MGRQYRHLQQSFAGGELSPTMKGRVADVKFQAGLERVRGFLIEPRGPAVRRPGTAHVGVEPGSDRAWLIPFRYSTTQAFALQFGRRANLDGRAIGYIRFHANGGTLQYTTPRDYVEPRSLTAVNTGAGVETIDFGAAHGLLTGDPIVWTVSGGALPTPLVAGTIYYAIQVDADTIAVATTFANAVADVRIDLTAAGAGDRKMHFAYEPGDLVKWLGAGSGNFYAMGRPWDTHLDHAPTDTNYWYREPADLTYEVPHFYAQAILGELTFAQSNDVLSIAHRDRPLAELRRLGATRWVMQTVTPATLTAPTGVQATATRGESYTLTNASIATPSLITVSVEIHLVLPQNQAVYMEAGVGDIPAGLYRIGSRSGLGNTILRLITVDGGVDVGSTVAGVTGAPKLFPTSLSSEQSTDYVVTAVNVGGQESIASSVASVTNNLFVNGASNTITWAAVAGAVRYRVYKKQTGLFGFIGESDASVALTFKDDNIAPDLGITPPTFDSSLIVSAAVTFDLGNDRVLWTGHGRAAGDPVIFSTGDTLPTGIELGVTYYVLNPATDYFQITADRDSIAAVNLGGAPAGCSATSGHFPGAVGYFEQRRWVCGAWTDPQKVMATRSGTESDFSYHIPTEDTDRIFHRIAARENHTIRHVIPTAHLLLLTSEGEYRVSPVNSDAITPDSFGARAESYVGAAPVQPAIVNAAVLFAAARGGHVYEAGFTQVGRLVAGDVSLRASHLFDGLEVEQMALSRAPLPIVWCVSSDGKLLGITYVPDQDVGAWHAHETDGFFESVCVIPEGDEDRVYLGVRRTINGATVRHVERMATQRFATIKDAFFVDDGLFFDGTNTGATTITPSAGGAWQAGSSVTLTASVATFAFPATTDVGDEVRLWASATPEVVYRVRITSTSSTTVATGTLLEALPVGLRDAATVAWAWARDSFAGLGHLEGEAVAVLADGVSVTGKTVASAAIALTTPAVKVAAGLPFTSLLRTLPRALQVDAALGSGRSQNVNGVFVRVDESGPFEVGPTGVAPVSSPVPASGALQTSQVPVTVPGSWGDDGQIDVQTSAPLPLTVVAVTIEGVTGG